MTIRLLNIWLSHEYILAIYTLSGCGMGIRLHPSHALVPIEDSCNGVCCCVYIAMGGIEGGGGGGGYFV